MRVLGIEIKGTDVQWIILDGIYTGGIVEKLDKNKIPLPKLGPQPIDDLIAVKDMMFSCLATRKIDEIGIIQAQGGAMGSKPIRAKIECMAELAAKALNIPCRLVAPQSVANAIKSKFSKTVSDSFQNAFCDGKALDPQYLDKAAYCAWIILNDNRQ